MPRQRRAWLPGAGAHIISRFVDRRFHLISDEDRRSYLRFIERAQQRWDWEWLSYALMSSHVHYGLVAGRAEPDRFFRSVHTRFAQQFHRRTEGETLGPVFAARPSLHPVKPGLLPRLVVYQHRNPVEAGVVDRPRDSTWTSHRAYMRLDPAPPWLDVERALDCLGFADTAAGRRRFDEYVTEYNLEIEALNGDCEGDSQQLTSSTSLSDTDWRRLVSLARNATGLPTRQLLSSKSRRAALTRRLICIVATGDLGQTYEFVATRLAMRTGSVFNLVLRPGPDGELDTLLAALRRSLVLA